MDKFFSLSISKVRNKNESYFLSDITNRIQLVQENYFSLRLSLFTGIIQFIDGLILSFIVEWRIIIFSFFVFVIIIVGVRLLDKKLTPLIEKINILFDEYTLKLKETLGMFRLLVSGDVEEIAINDLENNFTKLYKVESKASSIVAYFSVFMQGILLLGIFIFVLFLVYLVKLGVFKQARIIYIISIISILIVPGIEIFQSIPKLNIGKEALKEFLYVTEDTKIEDFESDIDFNYDHAIEFNNLKFNYDEKEIFNNFNLQILKNDKCILIGDSGSGKSTLLKLILGYLDDYEVEVLFFGSKVKNISEKIIYENIAYIEQQVFLFEGTIYDNICLGNNYSNEKIEDVIKKSGLDNLIKNKGLDYIINEDKTNLSGGEKVRIAIARALIRDAKILLLDEPFAHLDINNAINIEREILNLKDVTVINEEFKNKYNKEIILK